MVSRQKVGMVVAEFFGAGFLTTVLLGVGKSGVGYSYFLASGVALAFLGSALWLARVSGAHFNPAVTLGMWSVRKISTVLAIAYIAAQLLGGYLSWFLYRYLTGQPLPATPQNAAWNVLVAEAIAGFVIVMGVAAATYQKYQGLKAAATVALAIFVGVMIASLGSNGIGNPAIALGVRAWSWSYVAGPLVGGVIGANLYLYLFAPASEVQAVIGGLKRKTAVAAKAQVKKAPAKKAAAKRKK